MAEVDYAQLQERYGGKYIAHRNGEVISSAETYDDLMDQLEESTVVWKDLIIAYIEPTNTVCVY